MKEKMENKDIFKIIQDQIDEEMCKVITDEINKRIDKILPNHMNYILEPERLRELIKHGLEFENMMKSINEQWTNQRLEVLDNGR